MDKKQIGPSFYDELASHGGLIGEHFTWHADGTIEFFDDTPQAVIDGVNAVYAAHDPTKASWSARQKNAKAMLAESDTTIMRCYENAVAVPAEWASYQKALRAIVGASTGDSNLPLPTKPAYPVGT